MSRVPRYRRHGWHKAALALTVFLVWGAWFVFPRGMLRLPWRFDPQELVEKSELKAKNFKLPVQEITSPQHGVKAYLLADASNPIISLNFVFKNAGFASDDEREQGLAQMAAALLTEGAGGLSVQELKEELESRAIKVGFSAGKDDFGGSLLTTKANARQAAEYLRMMLTEPRFEQADIQRTKAQMLEMLKRQSEHPARVLELEFAKELYGEHPYGRNPLGQAEDIERITAADLRRFVQNNFSRSNIIVGIAGDVDAAEAEEMLDKIFGGLPENGRIDFVREAEVCFDGRSRKIRRDSGQNMVLKALPGVGRSHEDFYPLFAANYIWGGAGLTSRLSQQIREKEGLTYGVYSYLSLDDKSPLLAVAFASTADKFAQADGLLRKETERFQQKGATEEELAAAKNYLIASYNLRFASIENIAEILTAMQKYNLGLDFLQKRNDYVANITLEQVNRAARKYFDKSRMVSVEIGRF